MVFRIAALSAALFAIPALAHADAAGCTKTLGKEVPKLVKSRGKAIAKCENNRAKGKLAPTTVCRPQCGSAADNAGEPCRTDADCTCSSDPNDVCPAGTCQAVNDMKTSDKLAKAASKASGKITPACATLPPLGPGCDSATDAASLADCLTGARQDNDLEQGNADTLMRALYSTAPVDDTLVKCQAAISKNVQKYVSTRMKTLVKCHDGIAKGKMTGPCPDTDTQADLDAASMKLATAVGKKCTEAQLSASSPELKFSFPCEAYKLVDFKRSDPNSNTNSLTATSRLLGCLTNVAAATADHQIDIIYPESESSAFTVGVAAGDATDTTAIFWTRVPDPNSGATLEYATNPGLGNPSSMGVTPDADGIVKVDVGLLAPKTVYYYRFKQGSNTSAVGRVKTAPDPNDSTTVLHIAWSGDSNAFNRPYTSLDPVRVLQPDAFFYIGDTIYGDDPLADGVVAMTQPEYEAKYRMNRSDAALRHLMEETGTYVMWDDHEVRNDFSGAALDPNGDPVFGARMKEGNRAFRHYMPIRDNGGDPNQLYRSFRFGSAAEFFLIDLRQYRSAKYTCCNDPNESGFVDEDESSTCTGDTVGEALLPSGSCSAIMAGAGRTYLGSAQKAWLKNGLLNSTATFKFIMNGPAVTQLLFDPYDRWEAYPAERTEILDYIVTNAIPNVVWLSTDLHAIVVSPTHVDVSGGHAVPEVVEGSIGENTLLRELPPSILGLLGSIPGILTQVSDFDIDHYNNVLLTVDPTALPDPTATLAFYDRTGAVIRTITFPQ